MNRFERIDSLLAAQAQKLNARLTKDRPDYPESLRTFQERRIDWQDGLLRKAIIIQPSFEPTGVNPNYWYLVAIAWYDPTVSNGWKRFDWEHTLVERQPFEVIEQNIAMLLASAESELANVKPDDCQPLGHRAEINT